MMTDKQLTDWFLKLQEQAGRTTDEQIQLALDDEQMREFVEQMAFAKRAFKHEEAGAEVPSVDEEWGKFAAAHTAPFTLRKVAATFAGIVVASGLAFAAFHVGRSDKAPEVVAGQTASVTVLVPDTAKTDTTAAAVSRVFNNVTLEKMLTEIAAAHHATVEFQNNEVRRLRFHFVWKCGDNLSRTVEKLNTFEAVDIVIENEKLIVR